MWGYKIIVLIEISGVAIRCRSDTYLIARKLWIYIYFKMLIKRLLSSAEVHNIISLICLACQNMHMLYVIHYISFRNIFLTFNVLFSCLSMSLF